MKTPAGNKRPSDVIGNAIAVAKIATGELLETPKKATNRKNSGKARAKTLSAEKRSEIAKKAAKKRWKEKDSIPSYLKPLRPLTRDYVDQ